ncbi:hypothetical protein D3C73_1212920 [compost metagenome]
MYGLSDAFLRPCTDACTIGKLQCSAVPLHVQHTSQHHRKLGAGNLALRLESTIGITADNALRRQLLNACFCPVACNVAELQIHVIYRLAFRIFYRFIIYCEYRNLGELVDFRCNLVIAYFAPNFNPTLFHFVVVKE